MTRNYQWALEKAREFQHRGDEMYPPGLSENATREVMKDADSPQMFEHQLRFLIEHSRKVKVTFETVSGIAQALLREGRTLPPVLAVWVADVLEGKRRKPAKGGDRLGGRDLLIQACVAFITIEGGIPATRSSPKGKSACDAAAEVWCLSYEAVERIWRARLGGRWAEAVRDFFEKK